MNGILYVAGGENVVNDEVATLEAYNPETDSWTTKAAMPTVLAIAASGVTNGMLILAGGGNPSATAAVEAYDPATDSWTARSSMLTARYAACGGVVNGVFYVAGGLTNDDYLALNILEAFQP